jgi:hypothetical protein
MAHFAELDEDGVVLRVLVISNDDVKDANGNESEEVGKDFCATISNNPWVQASYNGNFRYNFPYPGDKYDSENDAFIRRKPFESWILDSHFKWQPPIFRPNDGKHYMWDESVVNWVEVNL